MIIGVSGKIGAGKSTFSQLAVKEFGAKRVAFADAVKEEVTEYLKSIKVPFKKANLYGTQDEKAQGFVLTPRFFDAVSGPSHELYLFLMQHPNTTLTFRFLMQWWGTEYRRAQDPDYWVKKAFEKCWGGGIHIIDDVRFKNEAEAVLAADGWLVRVNRKGHTGKHASEIDLDDYDHWDKVIKNNGDLKAYRAAVRLFLEEVTC